MQAAFIPALRISQRLSKPFWPPALASQAPPAIILAVLRRFRGSALLRGLCPSSSQGAPFWPSGLTLRSSGLAFSQPLTLAVRAHMESWHLIAIALSVTIVLSGWRVVRSYQTPEGKLPPRVVGYTALAWVISIPIVWGVTGSLAGEPFWHSAAMPGKAVIKALPYFLKAL